MRDWIKVLVSGILSLIIVGAIVLFIITNPLIFFGALVALVLGAVIIFSILYLAVKIYELLFER